VSLRAHRYHPTRPMNTRDGLPSGLKIFTVWALLGLLVFLGVQAWQHRQQQSRFRSEGGVVELRRGDDGHYHWPGTVNGEAVDFLVDTGATRTALPLAMAERLGLPSEGEVRSDTAGGVVRGQQVRADISLRGGVTAERLRVTALPRLGPAPLLGMDVLGQLKWQQGDGVMRFTLPNAPR
jgi:aspartyl protease family protein